MPFDRQAWQAQPYDPVPLLSAPLRMMQGTAVSLGEPGAAMIILDLCGLGDRLEWTGLRVGLVREDVRTLRDFCTAVLEAADAV